MIIIKRLQAALLLAAFLAAGNKSFAASTGELLQQGLYAEEVEGNPEAAFKIYAQIVQSDSAAPNHVAQALYRMAVCCVKTNDDATAKKLVAKLVAEHAGEKEIVEKASALVDNLSDFDPASLMPPGTLAYIEFGSPGQQVETILSALKGTPYENPLAAVSGAQPPSANAGQKSPGDILGALLNPSMVTEFKKVHNSAIGFTGIALQNPPWIGVLSPGKSDALRGLILAGLAVTGTQGEPIEGMQTVNIHLPDQKTIAVAYDERIIIAAMPAMQLPWCVKQYKGLISEPSLASGNKSFAKLDKAQRRKNALSVWANVGEAYGQVLKSFPPGKLPAEFVTANAMIDFTNIDSLTASDSIDPDGGGTRVELQFKDGHQCLAFDLIRTPNIGKGALESVPPQAVALVSFSLSQSSPAQTETVRAQVHNITGLEIGREMFANIEQVVLFAMPAEGGSARSIEGDFLPGRIGLALTSRNPEQTRQVLTTLLGTVNPASAPQQDSGTTRFKIGKSGELDLYCFLNQVGTSTLLSLNRVVLNASVSALKNHESVLTSGSLKGVVNKLPADASKLVAVNAGGAIRLIGPKVTPGELSGEQAEQFHASMNQLAQALDKTVVELRTDERVDNLAVNSRVSGLPPLNEVIGPATQMARFVQQARGEAKASDLRQQAPALIMPAAKPPVIDGKADEVWSQAREYKLANEIKSLGSGEQSLPISSPDDLSANFRALWDDKNLYVLVDVTDDKLVSDTDPDNALTVPSGSKTIPWWYDDSVEVYLDADNAKSAEYGKHDAMFRFNWGEKPVMRIYNQNVEIQLEGVHYAMVKTDKGYRLEASFPWAAFNQNPSVGATIGLDVHVNDDDNGGARDHKITWHDTTDDSYRSPQSFGNGLLGGLVGWWKFDETEGTTARDSSGFNHDGALVGSATWSTGKIGGAIKLDGNGSFVRIAGKSAFNMGEEVTIAGWVNMHSVPVEWMSIVTKGDNAWRLSTANQDRRFHFSVNDWDRIAVNGTTTVAADTWHQVVAVYDSHKAKLYVDGKLDAQEPWTEGIGRNNAEVLIGENAEKKDRCFDGLIDDMRIYNYALTEEEIKALAAPRVAAQ